MNSTQQFLQQHGLDDHHVYLLELVPLIQMIWADGKNQKSEIDILRQFATEHLAQLTQHNEGILPVTVESTNDFLNRFLLAPPPAEMLEALNQLCAQRLRDHSNIEYSRQKSEDIINFCLDIAAACAADYPYEFDERIVQQEKTLLRKLVMQFNV